MYSLTTLSLELSSSLLSFSCMSLQSLRKIYEDPSTTDFDDENLFLDNLEMLS